VSRTSAGAATLAAGARTLAGGAGSLAAGAAQARNGGGTLVTGLDRLLAGGSRLSTGLQKAQAGGSLLARSLTKGAASLPAYDRRQRAGHAQAMSDPIHLQTQRVDPVPDYGTGFAPYFIPLALWVGALMTYFIVRPLSGRALASTLPDADVALAGLWPGVVVTSVQAVVLVCVLELTLGLHPVEPAALLLFALVSAFAFTAILQFLSAALGTAGKFVAIVLLMLQLTSSAGTFPLQTVPRFFQLINPWLPMTYVVSGLRQAISGGDLRALTADTAILLGFAALGVCGTILTAHRRRTWTMARLKPVVTLQ
jgi:putative membrane protein